MSAHVFISYSHAATDARYVDELSEFLSEAGVAVWYDRDIGPGDWWTRVISDRIDTCAAFVVVMTPEAEKSRWVDNEIIRATNSGRRIFPLLLRGRPFLSVGSVQHADVVGGGMPDEEFVEGLRQALAVATSLPGADRAEVGAPPRLSARAEHFVGRDVALARLTGWLSDESEAARICAVTGRPGSGKSALVAEGLARMGGFRIGLTARSLTREAFSVRLKDALRERVPGRAALVVVDGVDVAASASDMRGILHQLGSLARQASGVRVLVEIRATGDHRSLKALNPEGVAEILEINLDEQPYYEPADVVKYVLALLTTPSPSGSESSAVLASTAVVERVASAVAARASGSFLVARLAALRWTKALAIDLSRTGWDDFPESVDVAVDEYLAEFGPHEVRIRDLLQPLAWAEGEGLSDRSVWASVATTLGTASYTEQDINQLLRDTTATDLLTQDPETGGYRLFHAALVAPIRRRTPLADRGAQVHRILADELERNVPANPDGTPAWSRADGYTVRFLPWHAMQAGQLNRLAADPSFLAAADPTQMLPLLVMVSRGRGRPGYIDAYRRSGHRHIELRNDPAGRRAVLAVDTARTCEPPLLRQLLARPDFADVPFRPLWAAGPPAPAALMFSLQFDVEVHTLGPAGTGSVVVINHDLACDLRTGELLDPTVEGEPMVQINDVPYDLRAENDQLILINRANLETTVLGRHPGVQAFGMLAHQDRAWAAAAGGGMLRSWEITDASAAVAVSIDAASLLPRYSLACVHLDGEPTAVVTIVDLEGTVTQALRLTDGAPVGRAREWESETLAVGGPAESPLVAVTGPGQKVTVLDLRTALLDDGPATATAAGSTGVRYESIEGPDRRTTSLAFRRVNSRPVLAVGGISAAADPTGFRGEVQVWDLELLRQRPTRSPAEPPIFTVAPSQGDPQTLLTTHVGGNIAGWETSSGRRTFGPITGPAERLYPVCGTRFRQRPVVVASVNQGHQVGSWFTNDGTQVHAPVTVPSTLVALAVVDVDADAPLIVVGGWDGSTVTGWRLSEHATPHRSELPGCRSISVLTSTTWRDRTVLLAGVDFSYRILDPLTLQVCAPVPTRNHTNAVIAITTAVLDGQPTVATGSYDGCVRFWNPETGEERWPYLEAHAGGVRSVIFDESGEGQIMLTTGDHDRAIRVWSVPDLPGPTPQPIEEIAMPGPGCELVTTPDSRYAAVVDGNLIMLDLNRDRLL